MAFSQECLARCWGRETDSSLNTKTRHPFVVYRTSTENTIPEKLVQYTSWILLLEILVDSSGVPTGHGVFVRSAHQLVPVWASWWVLTLYVGMMEQNFLNEFMVDVSTKRQDVQDVVNQVPPVYSVHHANGWCEVTQNVFSNYDG